MQKLFQPPCTSIEHNPYTKYSYTNTFLHQKSVITTKASNELRTPVPPINTMNTNGAITNQPDTSPSLSTTLDATMMPASPPGIQLQSEKKGASPLKRSRDQIETSNGEEEEGGDVNVTTTKPITGTTNSTDDVIALEPNASNVLPVNSKRQVKKLKLNVQEGENENQTQVVEQTVRVSKKDENEVAQIKACTDSNEEKDEVVGDSSNNTAAPTAETAAAVESIAQPVTEASVANDSLSAPATTSTATVAEAEAIATNPTSNDVTAIKTTTVIKNPFQSPPPVKITMRNAPPKATEQTAKAQQASVPAPASVSVSSSLPSIRNFHLIIPTASSAMVSNNASTDFIRSDMPVSSQGSACNRFKPAMKKSIRLTDDNNHNNVDDGPIATTKLSPPVQFLECKPDQTQKNNGNVGDSITTNITNSDTNNGDANTDANTSTNNELDVEKTLLTDISNKKEVIDSPGSIATPTATTTTTNQNTQDAEGRVNGLYHYYFKRPIDRLTPIPVKFNKTTPTDTDAEGEFVKPEPIRPMHVPR